MEFTILNKYTTIVIQVGNYVTRIYLLEYNSYIIITFTQAFYQTRRLYQV